MIDILFEKYRIINIQFFSYITLVAAILNCLLRLTGARYQQSVGRFGFSIPRLGYNRRDKKLPKSERKRGFQRLRAHARVLLN